jgi:hypothetical protein
MAYNPDTARGQAERLMVKFLWEQTGISETQALELIQSLGMERSSLLREAREISKDLRKLGENR